MKTMKRAISIPPKVVWLVFITVMLSSLIGCTSTPSATITYPLPSATIYNEIILIRGIAMEVDTITIELIADNDELLFNDQISVRDELWEVEFLSPARSGRIKVSGNDDLVLTEQQIQIAPRFDRPSGSYASFTEDSIEISEDSIVVSGLASGIATDELEVQLLADNQSVKRVIADYENVYVLDEIPWSATITIPPDTTGQLSLNLINLRQTEESSLAQIEVSQP